MLRVLILTATHGAMLGIGFLIGIYVLPILTAPKGPDAAALQATTTGALYTGRFERNLKGSDIVHWGEGEVRVLPDRIAHAGRLAPGPDYKLFWRPSSSIPRKGSWRSRTSLSASAT